MSGLEVLGSVASVVQLAATVYSISKTLYEVGDALSNAPSDIKDLARDLETFSEELHLLSTLLDGKNNRYSDRVYKLTAKIIGDCATICQKIDRVLKKLRSGSFWSKVKWVYKEKEVLKLLTRLRDLKLSLMGTLSLLSALKADTMMDAMGVGSSSLLEGTRDEEVAKQAAIDMEDARQKLAGIALKQPQETVSVVPQQSWSSQASTLGPSRNKVRSTKQSSVRGLDATSSSSPFMSAVVLPSQQLSVANQLMKNTAALESVDSFHTANISFEDEEVSSRPQRQNATVETATTPLHTQFMSPRDFLLRRKWRDETIEVAIKHFQMTQEDAAAWAASVPVPDIERLRAKSGAETRNSFLSAPNSTAEQLNNSDADHSPLRDDKDEGVGGEEKFDAMGNKIISTRKAKKLTSSELRKKKMERMARRKREEEVFSDEDEDRGQDVSPHVPGNNTSDLGMPHKPTVAREGKPGGRGGRGGRIRYQDSVEQESQYRQDPKARTRRPSINRHSVSYDLDGRGAVAASIASSISGRRRQSRDEEAVVSGDEKSNIIRGPIGGATDRIELEAVVGKNPPMPEFGFGGIDSNDESDIEAIKESETLTSRRSNYTSFIDDDDDDDSDFEAAAGIEAMHLADQQDQMGGLLFCSYEPPFVQHQSQEESSDSDYKHMDLGLIDWGYDAPFSYGVDIIEAHTGHSSEKMKDQSRLIPLPQELGQSDSINRDIMSPAGNEVRTISLITMSAGQHSQLWSRAFFRLQESNQQVAIRLEKIWRNASRAAMAEAKTDTAIDPKTAEYAQRLTKLILQGVLEVHLKRQKRSAGGISESVLTSIGRIKDIMKVIGETLNFRVGAFAWVCLCEAILVCQSVDCERYTKSNSILDFA